MQIHNNILEGYEMNRLEWIIPDLYDDNVLSYNLKHNVIKLLSQIGGYIKIMCFKINYITASFVIFYLLCNILWFAPITKHSEHCLPTLVSTLGHTRDSYNRPMPFQTLNIK